MPVFWLQDDTNSFPHPELANREGILAVGGTLSAERLLLAYRKGIFPWFNPDDPIIWWSPDPRFVLFPEELKVSRSMRPYFNQLKFQVSYDQAFRNVINACQSSKRPNQGGETWITGSMVDAYCKLHELGYAHSVEVWNDDRLVGGLYGVSLGKCFFGESMFSLESNASKFGLISLTHELQERGFWLIDCQQETSHLASMGARSIPRKFFLEILERNESEKTLCGSWNTWSKFF